MKDYTIRLAEINDADAYVRTHTQALIETYTPIMPPEYAAGRLAEIPEWVARRTAAFTQMHADLASGLVPDRTHWVAVDDAGSIVGVAASGIGQPPWEHLLHLPEPPIDHQLDHIYTLAAAHGSGLGQRLLETALPDGKGAYLWVLNGNPRAEAFYRRNGFVPDGFATTCGPAWFHRPMFRMWRPDDGGENQPGFRRAATNYYDHS